MIRDNLSQPVRLEKLNQYALVQLKSLQNSVSVGKLEAADRME